MFRTLATVFHGIVFYPAFSRILDTGLRFCLRHLSMIEPMLIHVSIFGKSALLLELY